MDRVVRRMAGEIVEHDRAADLILVGIRTRGVPLAEGLAAEIGRMEGQEVARGILDITLYRDDLSTIGAAAIVAPHLPRSPSTTRSSSSATTCSTPGAPCARRSTR